MEPEKKSNTIWVNNASFQLINAIGKKQKINTDGEQAIAYTGQDT